MAKKLDAERIEQARHKGEKTGSRNEAVKREIQETIAKNRSGERKGHVIMPQKKEYAYQDAPKVRVAAYCRVSTAEEAQEGSFEMQVQHLNYPQNVQYCLDATQKVFAIRVCKGNEAKATPFSKPRAEQTTTLSCSNKNLRDVIVAMIPDFDAKKRYKVTGEYDAENRVMYYDMATAEESNFRNNVGKGE